MRLTTRLQTLEWKLRSDGAPPRFVFVLEHEDGVWRDGRRDLIDPATVSGPLRIMRLVTAVGVPTPDELAMMRQERSTETVQESRASGA